MGNIEELPVLSVITGKYDEIFQSEKKVADFILKHPNEAINLNVSELASQSGVSDATVVRLCKHLGYQGYYQMKICLFRDSVAGKENTKKAQEQDSSMAFYVQEMSDLMKQIQNLNAEESFLECVRIMKNSPIIHLCAAGNTATLSMYTGFRLERLGFRCCYNQQPEYFMNHINLASPEECLLVISQSGTSRNVVSAVELAKKKGMKVLAVSAYQHSPISQRADAMLMSPEFPVIRGNIQHSRLGEMAVLEILLRMLENEETEPTNETMDPEMILAEEKY
jgi:DNA-binding MurR/RpiR family transcriptional regulator